MAACACNAGFAGLTCQLVCLINMQEVHGRCAKCAVGSTKGEGTGSCVAIPQQFYTNFVLPTPSADAALLLAEVHAFIEALSPGVYLQRDFAFTATDE